MGESAWHRRLEAVWGHWFTIGPQCEPPAEVRARWYCSGCDELHEVTIRPGEPYGVEEGDE